MSYLGQPYKLYYEAKFFHQGLLDVMAFVERPDGVILGPYHLAESPSPLRGGYSAIYESNVNDSVGQYIIRYISPSEGNQSSSRMEFMRDPGTTAAQQSTSGVTLTGILKTEQMKASVRSSVGIEGKIRNDGLIAEVKDSTKLVVSLDKTEMVGRIDNKNLKGEINGQLNLP